MIKKKKLYAALMTYEVSEDEKEKAMKALRAFDYLLKLIDFCNDHLDLIYIPFKDNQNITPEQTYAARAALRRYRDKVADNFNGLKRISFRCIVLLQPFASDTQIIKLNKAFTMSVGDIEIQVNRFIDLFSNLEAKDFSQSIVKGVEGIKKELAQLEQLIDERMKEHLQNNILAINWVDSISDELQEKIEQKIPLSVSLVEERNNKLEQLSKNNDK